MPFVGRIAALRPATITAAVGASTWQLLPVCGDRRAVRRRGSAFWISLHASAPIECCAPRIRRTVVQRAS